MAKDVDLSSKEWTDIIFDGRNKEYGAYLLRTESEKRHNKAMLYTVLGFLILCGLIVGWTAYQDYRKAKAEEEAQAALLAAMDQQQFEVELTPEDEPEEENQMQQEEIEIPEALPEEILNTEKFTEFLVVDNEQEIEQVKTNDEIKETETAIGQTNFDQGTDDLNVVREHKDEVIVEEKKPEPVKDEVFQSVEQMPVFPGGEAELLKWISTHIKYPTIAMENGIQGRVTIRFVVTKDGSIGEVQVARGKDPDLDKEAVRVVKSLPKFNPGRMNGQPVSVWYTLPVNFKLQGM